MLKNIFFTIIISCAAACTAQTDSTISASSPRLGGQVLNVQCEEFSPALIGDACLILIRDDEFKLTAVLSDFDDFVQFDPNWEDMNQGIALIGKTAIIDESCLSDLENDELSLLSDNLSWDDEEVAITFKKLNNSKCFAFTER